MAEQQERTPGIIDQAKAAYEQVVCAIIRPPRTTYDERHLGPRRFELMQNSRFVNDHVNQSIEHLSSAEGKKVHILNLCNIFLPGN